MSNEVHDELDDIFSYISNDSSKYANKTVKEIRNSINKLEYAPYMGRYVPELNDKKYREIVHKSYRIVYEVSKNNYINVHFIIHYRRNFISFYNSYKKNNF